MEFFKTGALVLNNDKQYAISDKLIGVIMLDIKFIRENPDRIKKSLRDRGMKVDVDKLLLLDKKKKKLLLKAEEQRRQRNLISEEIGNLKQAGAQDANKKIAEMRAVSRRIKELDNKIKEVTREQEEIAILIPNIPHQSVPIGSGPEDNVEVRSWGEPPKFDFAPRSHYEIAKSLKIIDFERAAKISGSGFALYCGWGAKLERALINFMLDLHTAKHNYTEVSPPFIAKRNCLVGTGQLPLLEDDMYILEKDDLFLIPTAEVPLTNIHANEILSESKLPIYYCAYTPCFRREAGSYGKETKGLIRVHQFDKVELVKFVKPETSEDELELLLKNAEEVLQLLGLHYRVVSLCTGDLSFAASKCYDIEVWAAGKRRYLEVSSCSSFSDFQARRAGIRYRDRNGGKLEYVHTLNGSGVALARLVVALLETYQQVDGSITIPEPLRTYMGRDKISKE